MSIGKIFSIISGISIIAISAFLFLPETKKDTDFPESLLSDYDKLLNDISAINNCDNPKIIANTIKDFENRLEDLQTRKNKIIESEKESNFIPELPEINEDNIIVEPIPGSEVPELSDGNYFDQVPELPEINEDNIVVEAIPGSETPELLDYYPNNDPRLGSEVPELSDGNYFDQVPELPEINEDNIIVEPIPGSEVPELSDGNYFDNTKNEIPKLPVLPEIENIERQIVEKLIALKSLCEDEKNNSNEKEIISNSCNEACKKYSDCASYTEDVTEVDIKDAFDSCMEECVKWSEKTVICVNKKQIKNPADCQVMTFCVLPEYDEEIEFVKQL
ncbi:MAG: hypothetical protein WC414_01355 [Patescibacteria group bacterium]